MVSKAKKLLDRLVSSMKRNGWIDDDIKDVLGKRTLKPASFGLGSLFRVAELYGLWLKVKSNGGLPNDQIVLQDIDDLTTGGKARRREMKHRNQEEMKVYQIEITRKSRGPVSQLPRIEVCFSTCNLRCKHCQKKETWTKGNMMSAKSLDAIIRKIDPEGSIPILLLSGGEPLLWQDKSSLLRLLYIWSMNPHHQVHLETNGTIYPKKLIRDICGLITVVPQVTAHGDYDYWRDTVERWERTSPPIWSPVLSKDDHETTRMAVKLFGMIERERIYPRPMTKNDKGFTRRTAVEMGWMMKDSL